MRRRLRSVKVRSHPSAKKIAFTENHRKQRMQFAREHLNTPQNEWNAVIWLDEKVFSSAEDEM